MQAGARGSQIQLFRPARNGVDRKSPHGLRKESIGKYAISSNSIHFSGQEHLAADLES